MDFTGKKVLITGASRGIGRACAVLFAEQGAKVAVHYGRSADAAQETLAMLKGEGHIVVQADMGDADAVQALVETAIRELGGLDILVNNAGIYEDHPVLDIDYATWQQNWYDILNVNLMGAANAIYHAAQHMKTNGGGSIVNVTSRGAFRGEPTAPAYGASKAGMNSMSQSMARALAPHGIIVTAVAPGWIATDMAAGHMNNPEHNIEAQSPLNRVGTPEEIAHAVLYLASDNAGFTTGAILDVNGASFFRN